MLLSYTRTIALYLVLILAVRLMGKRQIGEMEPAEFVVTMLIANLAAIPMQDGRLPLLSGLIPILTVLAVQLLLSYGSMKSLLLRSLLCGKPVFLIREGVISQSALRRCRVTVDELTEQLRQKDVLDPLTVRYAILETDGQLSVIPYSAGQSLPVMLVSDGHLLKKNLKASGRDRVWVIRHLRRKGLTVKKTFLMTLDGSGKTTVIAREGSR